MKTVTFYSYKGGVGRSLALSNIAIRLSELKKKVCVLDFDLEAPGLHFKFNNYSKSQPIQKGLVDYIDEFSSNATIPESVKAYSIDLVPANNIFEKIQLIPAGNIDDAAYWKKLSSIDWSKMFYEEGSRGVQFFLNLKHKIETELKPDFLLIDSRTGITDIAGITLKLLADEVVILAANNQENIFGSKKIIKSLTGNDNILLGRNPKITFILTRLPFTDTPKDKAKEFSILRNRTIEFKNELSLSEFEVMIIHSDRRLEENEIPLIGDDYEAKGISISNDYLKLFDKLTSDVLTPEELSLFRDRKNAEKEYVAALNETDSAKKIFHFSKAIEHVSNKFEYYLERGTVFSSIENYEDAVKDFTTALNLNPDSKEVLRRLAWLFGFKNQFDLALNYSEKAIQKDINDYDSLYTKALILTRKKDYSKALEIFSYIIEQSTSDSQVSNVLNSRANNLRVIGDYDNAYKDIFRAIEVSPDQAVYFATLAEIYASDGKINEFYLNLSIALSKGITGQTLNEAKDVYQKFLNDEKFISLMAKYSIDVNEILSGNDQ